MRAVAALRNQFGGHAVKMLDDEEAEQVHAGAEPKHDEGAARPGAGAEAPGGESGDQAAAEAGPTSGSGETDGTPGPQDGPSSGSGSTGPGAQA